MLWFIPLKYLLKKIHIQIRETVQDIKKLNKAEKIRTNI